MSNPVKAVLDRHIDDDPPRLDFSVPIDRLIDIDHCETLSTDIQQAAPDGWEVVKATKSAWRMIPASPGLYMFVWHPTLGLKVAASGHRKTFPYVLYVGKAGDGRNRSNLKARYKTEYAHLVASDPEILWDGNPANTRESRLRRYLALRPLQFWYCAIDDGSVIANLERRIFSVISPPLNSAGSPRLRATGKSQPAF